jgi:hypothetical protein
LIISDNPTHPGAEALPPCDLVMKGGITSGIVYPGLIARLARDYRFQNIGGTSAGAIAAAACAAAELGRRSGRNADAYAALAALPQELQTQENGRSRLARLFQPAPALQRHFDLGMRYIETADKDRALLSVLFALLHWETVLGAALLLLVPLLMLAIRNGALWSIAATLGMLGVAAGAAYLAHRACRLLWRAPPLRRELAVTAACALLVLVLTLASLPQRAGPFNIGLQVPFVLLVPLCLALGLGWGLWRAASTLLDGLHRNFYGICGGRSTGSESVAGLSDWLDAYLNQLAGLPPGQPLTFGDLWGHDQAADQARAPRAINLEVVTTALSQQMPYSIPFRDNAGAFYFDPAEWERLFPSGVMAWLREHAPAAPSQGALTTPGGKPLLQLVDNARLPVMVAVRMSLSFPLLLSAVPLYARDFSENGKLKRVWFSDGGISSNMPLHFFDELLPLHPTFAINLKQAHPLYPITDPATCGSDGRVFLPDSNLGGTRRYWAPPDDATPAGLFGFFGDIVATMQSWRDEILFPYPGYRDRIVQISLREGEGGLNLNMAQPVVDALSAAGACAGEMLYRQFHPAAGGKGWLNHEQVQILSVLGNLELLAKRAGAPGATARWQQAVARGRLTGEDRRLADQLLADLAAMGAHVQAGDGSVEARMYRPNPVMKLTPRI